MKTRNASSSLRRLAGVASALVDDQVGIVRRIQEVPREAGAPDFFHFVGQACDASAFAEQPNFSFTGGASTDRGRALAKAIGEAIERYSSALFVRDELPLVTYAEAPFECVRPDEFALYSRAQYDSPGFPWAPFDVSTSIRWTPARELPSGRTVHVPATRVFIPYFFEAGSGDTPIDQPISTGLACHTTFAEAALSAVCEVVERDAALIAWQARLSPPQIRVETLSDVNYEIVRRFESVGDQVVLLDITLDHGIPVILAALRSSRPLAPALVFAPACHPDPEIATRKALEELAHTRRYCQWVKTYAPRIVPDPPTYECVHDQRDHLNFYVDAANSGATRFFFESERRVEFDALPNLSSGRAQTDLATVVEKIQAVGERVCVVDLTSSDVRELGLHVVRAVIPGFHPLHMGFDTRSLGGHRLWNVPQRLGYPGVKVETGDNPAPHPYP